VRAVDEISVLKPSVPKSKALSVVAVKPVINDDVGKFGDFFGDIGKAIAYGVAAPVNSITGHKYDPDFKTKAGAVLGKGSNIGHDSLHIAGKAFADTISGGAATKLANKIRKDENKESAFNYTEMRGFKNADTGVKVIDKGFDVLEKVSKTGALVGGAFFGGKAAAGAVKKLGGSLPVAFSAEKPSAETLSTKVESSGGNSLGLLAVAAALLLK
jgi:hypothetical protein